MGAPSIGAGTEVSEAQMLAYLGDLLIEMDEMAERLGRARLRYFLRCALDEARAPTAADESSD